MNKQLTGSKSSILQFLFKTAVIAITIVTIYHYTIATFVEKAVSFMGILEPVLVEVKPIFNKVELQLDQLREIEGILQADPDSVGFI